MERIEITKRGKQILLALYKGEYPNQVPDEDYEEFNLLEVLCLVHAVKTKGNNRCEMHAPRLTEYGLAYITSNPSLQNPSKPMDWKWIIGIIVAIAGVVAAFLAL